MNGPVNMIHLQNSARKLKVGSNRYDFANNFNARILASFSMISKSDAKDFHDEQQSVVIILFRVECEILCHFQILPLKLIVTCTNPFVC